MTLTLMKLQPTSTAVRMSSSSVFLRAPLENELWCLLNFLLYVGTAFGLVALERSIRMATLKKNKLGETSEEDRLEVTMRTAASLKQALLGLGTSFIKVAQSLSARPDVIGTETAKVLSELHDRLPPFPKEEAIAIIEEELGCRASEAFSFLSDEPVAAASFGQVQALAKENGYSIQALL